ncbi:16S rRNA (cytosine(1402)-N(4))-methyltransferase RsmH [Acidithiobacillus sp.]|uniref:16S rRNA (cytosine(1402)-N(4))-methyltransferase RsmH n=1 Tax=Acidithiobacillus sp. TaxID=1872118 RepID=UPI0025C6B020|nr:16S rRNA (cytosine(1402)-N(4))-methyltransferase RsmH [Acidithiobacillus sp.]
MTDAHPTAASHEPVLLAEVLACCEALLEQPGPRLWVDATGGRGGHSAALLDRLAAADRLLILDRDPEAVAYLRSRFGGDPRVVVHHARFSEMARVLAASGAQQAQFILADLGVSSPQLDCAERGFSFLRDGPLDMRMDPGRGMSAAEWLAGAEVGEIAQVLRDYGEEREARRIARAIVAARATTPLTRTSHLADLVTSLLPRARAQAIHPATRTFQAIRMHINDELGEIRAFLPAAMDCLAPGGRLAVISFHSLEDRWIKRFFRADALQPDPDLPLRATEIPESPWFALGRAIRASAAEIAHNPRARSALLRVAQKRGGPHRAS